MTPFRAFLCRAPFANSCRPERSMARGGQAPLPEPPFSVPALHPEPTLPATDMQAGACVLFTSRHEQLHAASDPQIKVKHKRTDDNKRSPAFEDSPQLEDACPQSSDSEAEAVKEWAATHQFRRGDRGAGRANPLGLRTLVRIAPRNHGIGIRL